MSIRQVKRNKYIAKLHKINKLSYEKIVPIITEKFGKRISRERVGAIYRNEIKTSNK